MSNATQSFVIIIGRPFGQLGARVIGKQGVIMFTCSSTFPKINMERTYFFGKHGYIYLETKEQKINR
jgi:hypothetical protein